MNTMMFKLFHSGMPLLSISSESAGCLNKAARFVFEQKRHLFVIASRSSAKGIPKSVLLIIRLLICCMLCFGSSMAVYAQSVTGGVRGRVVDEASGEPLAGAIVATASQKATADAQGLFTLTSLPPGRLTLSISFMGYHTAHKEVTVTPGAVVPLRVALVADAQKLHEVVVMAKSRARQVREQAQPVTVISMKQLQGTVSDVQGILAKTVGVTIRASGGVGSTSRLSVRGLEGKRIGFFIDEIPLGEQSEFIDLNDIPVDMIDRIEIYKGVVPAKFGGSSMGGAVNLVIKEYPPRYADVSIIQESFHNTRAQAVFKRNLEKSGLLVGIGGGITDARNDYEMESPYVEGLKMKRDHDRYKKVFVGGSIKATKWWFDKIELEPVYVHTYREIQGIATDIRQAHSVSDAWILGNTFKKHDMLLPGLDMEWRHAIAYTRYCLVDTAKTWYDWYGNAYPTPSVYGGEIGNRFPSDSKNGKLTYMNKLNLEYLINSHHTVTLNSLFNAAASRPSDPLKEKSLGKRVDFNSNMRSWVLGLSYDYHTADDRWLNSFTLRYYLYSMNTKYQNLYIDLPPTSINLHKQSVGFSNAMRYRFTPVFLGKLSGGIDVRIPGEAELLGDGYLIAPSERLLPEKNTSVNLGVLYDLTGKSPSNLQVELSTYYMYLRDMIRFTPGFVGAQYRNFGEMRSLGVELEAKADVLSWLYLYGNITYQDLRDTRRYEENSTVPNATRNKRMPNVPYFMGNAGIELHRENLFGGKWQNSRFMADLSYVHEYYYDFELTQLEKRRIPTSFVIDLGVEHSFFHQRLYLSAKVKNLTNRRVLSEYNRPLPGRSFGVKLRYIFR